MSGECLQVGTGIRIPKTDGGIRTSTGKDALKGMEGRAQDTRSMSRESGVEFPGVRVPQVYFPILGPTGQHTAIEGTEGGTRNGRRMPQNEGGCPGEDIP